MTGIDSKRRGALLRLALALVLFKIFVLLVALSSPVLLPGFFSENYYRGNFHWPPDEAPHALTTLKTWDAQHYLYLATEGYKPGRMPIAFFPLYPWLIRALATLPGVGSQAAALLLANGLSIAAVLLLFDLLRRRHPGTEEWTTVFLLAFPGALFFHFPYTESLFLFLAVAVLAAIERDRWGVAAGAAFLLALTRPNGVLIAGLLAYELLVRVRRKQRPTPMMLLCVGAPVLGLGAYFLFMQAATGDAMAGIEMQRAFHAGRSVTNLFDVGGMLLNLLDVEVIHGIQHSLLDRLAFLLVLATLVPLWRIDKALFWFALPMALLGPLSGSLVSYTRFAAVIFPTSLVLARALGGQDRVFYRYLTAAVFFVVQIILLLRHATNHWAG